MTPSTPLGTGGTPGPWGTIAYYNLLEKLEPAGPGDLVTLKGTVFPVDLTFKIVGEIPNARAPHFWFQREYLEQAVEANGGTFDFLGTIWVRVDSPARLDPLARQIDETFRNSEAQTSSENEKSYFKNFFGALEGLVFLIMLVTALVAICIVFIAANTASSGGPSTRPVGWAGYLLLTHVNPCARIIRCTSGVKRNTCDRRRGRTCAAALLAGAAPRPRATSDAPIGVDLLEGLTFGATTSCNSTPSGSRSQIPLPSPRGCGCAKAPDLPMRSRNADSFSAKIPEVTNSSFFAGPSKTRPHKCSLPNVRSSRRAPSCPSASTWQSPWHPPSPRRRLRWPSTCRWRVTGRWWPADAAHC